MPEVLLGRCVAGFQPSEQLCKKLVEDYDWELFVDHRGEEEDRESEEFWENENEYGVEAIKKEVFHHEDGETSTDWRFLTFEEEELRTHPDILEAVKELGDDCIQGDREWAIAEVPDDIEWKISENDPGYEWVAEKHRIWTGEDDPSYTVG